MSSSTSSLSSSSSSTVVRTKSDPNRSSDSDMNLDVDVDVDADVADIEKGQEVSVAVAQQAQQQQPQQHSDKNEEVISQGLTTTEEDEKAACRSMMMMMPQQENSSSFCIRISDLSSTVRKSIKALELDVDGDGQLDTDEILWAMNQLTTQMKIHSNLKQMIVGLCTFLMLLISCLVASSMTAVRLVNDTEIDPVSGIMYVKQRRGGNAAYRSRTIMKTEAVEIYSNATILANMSNDELDILKAILPGNNGDVKFQVKGYARNNNGTNNDEEIMVLVEGGTITYDRKGITDATGNAKVLLTFAYGDVFDYSNHDRYSCNDGYVSGGQGEPPHL